MEEPSITRFRGLTLNRFQREAVAAIEAGEDVVVSAPTGAGKTLVAEYAIDLCLRTGRRAIFTAPIKALSNQKYRDFREEGIETGIMTGDVTIRADAPVLLMTTEIFRNAIFERGRELDDVGYVVFDEIHYMDDRERGTVWEESLIFAPPHVRILALSATVSNLRQFCDWISEVRGREVVRIESKDRPVPLAHYLHFPGMGPRRADKVSKLPRPKPEKKESRGRGRPRFGRFSRSDDLLDRLEREDRLPVLFFCFSRKECGIRARENAKRRLLGDDDRAKIEALFDDIVDRFEIQEEESLAELRDLASCGISYHHAGLLPLHKELVERLFTSGLLKLLFTTETFALGINMPARTVVFSSLRKFDGISFDRMRARDYQQMAGRAGRQGLDDEGLVYSLIDDPRNRLPDIQASIFGSIEPIRSRFNLSYSSLLNLHHHLGDKIYEAWEKSFNNYQWARMSRKKREKNEEKQKDAIQRRLGLLADFDYLDEDGLLEKGKRARAINGYELPSVELVSSGLVQALSDLQVAVIFVALVYEDRKGDLSRRMSPKLLGVHQKDAERIIQHIIDAELDAGMTTTTRPLNFRLGAVVQAWWNNWSFKDLGELTNVTQGDLVRTMRLAVQLLRQLARTYRDDRDLCDTFHRAMDGLNRDEVDARRQLELGDPDFR